MKKILILMLVLAMSMMAFTACGNGDSDSNEGNPLVGFWVWADDGITPLNFDVDGTGNRNWWGGFDFFNWTTDGNHLRMDMTSGIVYDLDFTNNESWTFTIDGDSLRIESRQAEDMVFYYNRAGS